MKKLSLLVCGLFGLGFGVSAQNNAQYEFPANFDAWNLNFKLPLEKMEQPTNQTPAPAPNVKRNTLRNAAENDDAGSQYFFVGQTFHKNFIFNYEGGTIATYNIGLKREGTKVIISNLFNLEAQSTDWSKGVDYDVEGVYDEAAKTITIPASSNFSNATICGTIGTFYTEVLAAGTVNDEGKMAPAEELVFNVIGDFEAITTDMHFAIMNYTNDGSNMFGMQTCYRKFYAKLPSATPELVAFNNSFDLGTAFPNTDAVASWNVVNMSTADVDYAISVESDENSCKAVPDAGSIPAQSVQEIALTFTPPTPGDYEGLVTLTYEADEEKSLEVLLTGQAVAYPDYSGIVKNGEFVFTTNIEHPFEMITLEDGTLAAQSTTKGAYGPPSKLTAEFEVPEGKIATVSWDGEYTNNGQWYQNVGGIYVDNNDTPWWTSNTTASLANSIELGPGKHSICWQYQGLYFTGDEKNALYVSNLDMALRQGEAKAVVIETPEITFPNQLITDETGVSADGQLIIRNKGFEPLTVTNVTTDNTVFTATRPTGSAALLESLTIPVKLNTNTPDTYNATVTIETSAGTVTAVVKCLVRKMDDFSSIVKEGADLVTGYETDVNYPFVMKDGKMVNANAGEADDVASKSWVKINFTVPEGKAVYLEWDAHAYGNMPDPEQHWIGDHAAFEIKHPMTTGNSSYFGEDIDAGSAATMGKDDFWAPYLVSVPGEHYLTFQFVKNGDGQISDKDCLEVSAVRLHMVDFKEHEVTPEVEVVNFDKTYVGPNRYLTATVKLKNTGSAALELLDDVESTAPFYGVLSKNRGPVQFNQTIDVGLWFYPTEEGEFEGDVTFKTTSGDVTIHCTGSTNDSEGILFIGDIEDEAQGWAYYDADGDGDCWNLGFNLWGLNPAWCHGGQNCFGSPSFTYSGGAIEPDNWLFSPVVTIPADGAVLNWFAASHHHERYAEHYSVYITSQEEISDVNNLSNLKPVYSRTLEPESADVWEEGVFDLKDYAGKDVVIAFRHHDCNGQYVLKLDDIFVFTNEKWNPAGIDMTDADAQVVATEIYDVNGMRRTQLSDGVNIVKITYSNGSSKAVKIFKK